VTDTLSALSSDSKD